MSNVYVPLSSDILVRLVERYGEDFDGVIDHVVEDFLDRTEEDFWDLEWKLGRPGGGFTWEQVFLPEGTQLGTRYLGEWLTADLKDGKFYFNGKAYPSPAQVCNAMRGGTSNNAWKVLKIKRPQDKSFRDAESFRRRAI